MAMIRMAVASLYKRFLETAGPCFLFPPSLTPAEEETKAQSRPVRLLCHQAWCPNPSHGHRAQAPTAPLSSLPALRVSRQTCLP